MTYLKCMEDCNGLDLSIKKSNDARLAYGLLTSGSGFNRVVLTSWDSKCYDRTVPIVRTRPCKQGCVAAQSALLLSTEGRQILDKTYSLPRSFTKIKYAWCSCGLSCCVRLSASLQALLTGSRNSFSRFRPTRSSALHQRLSRSVGKSI